MNAETKVKAAWRAALIAYWKSEGCYQRAENLGRGVPFDHQDERAIESLQAGAEGGMSDLPREVSRGTMRLGPLEMEVIHLDNGQRLITPEGLAAFTRWLETGEALEMKNVTP